MELIEKLLNRPEWNERVHQAISSAFRSVGFKPDAFDLAAAENDLRYRLVEPMTHEEGEHVKSHVFLPKLARFSVLAYLSDRDTKVGKTSCTLLAEAELDLHTDPLFGSNLLRLFGGDDEDLQTAPYEVQFGSAQPEVERYKQNAFALPSFTVVDRAEKARRATWINGQRRKLHHHHTPFHSHLALEHQKGLYASALRRALPGYMHWLGITSLKPLDQSVIRTIKETHASNADVKRKLGIPHSSYHELMGRLLSRGYEDTKDALGRRVLLYNPVLDSTARFMDRESYDRIFSLATAELIEDNEHLYYRILEDDHMSLDAFLHIAQTQRLELLRAKMSVDAIERHDARLRAFIKRSVERPVIGKGVTLSDVEKVLASLSHVEAKELVFKSLRCQRPVTEMLGIRSLIILGHADESTNERAYLG